MINLELYVLKVKRLSLICSKIIAKIFIFISPKSNALIQDEDIKLKTVRKMEGWLL